MNTQATLSVANYLIGKAQHEGVPITPMKLLQLVYIAHGWCLGLYAAPLIAEQVQACRYGPVVPSVYSDFRHYGRSQIVRQKAILNERDEYVVPTVHDPEVRGLLDRVWDVYKMFDGLQLSDITHHPDTPWDITWKQSGGKNAQIPTALIQEHYRKLSQRHDGSCAAFRAISNPKAKMPPPRGRVSAAAAVSNHSRCINVSTRATATNRPP